MTLQFTNTATRSKERFVPIDDKNVRMYVCGPTVYDFAHIGNARPAVVFDVLFRLLRHVYGEDHVTYVRNITDVDDKINARAARDFPDLPLNDAIARVTEKTTLQYHADLAALGCLEPTHEPRATAHIPGMIAMIETLIGKGNAYVAEGDEGQEVLFDTASMDGSSGPSYGALSKRNLDEQKAGARIDVEGHKRNPGDFVLWKQSSAEEPGWESPWGRGRPGWHIECSVMSAHHLGTTFDIHGGGLDLIFPHHENEIAQSCCAHGTDKMANTWLHNGFVQVEGRKMSKSEGNFVTIHDVLHTDKVGGRKWPGEVVRLALLMTHYREPLDFSVKRLEEAENVLSRWRSTWHDIEISVLLEEAELSPNLLDIIIDDLDLATLINRISEHYSNPERSQTERAQVYHWMSFLGLAPSREEIIEILRPALQSANAALEGMRHGLTSFSLPKIEIFDFAVHARGMLELFESVEKYSSATVTVGDVEDIEKAIDFNSLNEEIEKRLALIAEKNWAEADRIRDELAGRGIALKDGKDPETGERTTTWEVKR